VLLTAFVLLTSFTTPAAAQKEKEKKKDGLDETTSALMDVLKKAAEDKDFRRDRKHGGGTTPYDEAPAKPGLIVGFDLYPGVRDKTVQYVRGVRAVYLTSDGKTTLGKVYGWTSGIGAVRVKAKDGYAVAGCKIHTSGDEIDGMSIVFAKITESGLDMKDSYDSKYYGHRDPDTAPKVVCTGEPIVGIRGLISEKASSHHFGFGLVVVGKDPKKDK
jgi:hypothetical protein